MSGEAEGARFESQRRGLRATAVSAIEQLTDLPLFSAVAVFPDLAEYLGRSIALPTPSPLLSATIDLGHPHPAQTRSRGLEVTVADSALPSWPILLKRKALHKSQHHSRQLDQLRVAHARAHSPSGLRCTRFTRLSKLRPARFPLVDGEVEER